MCLISSYRTQVMMKTMSKMKTTFHDSNHVFSWFESNQAEGFSRKFWPLIRIKSRRAEILIFLPKNSILTCNIINIIIHHKTPKFLASNDRKSHYIYHITCIQGSITTQGSFMPIISCTSKNWNTKQGVHAINTYDT